LGTASAALTLIAVLVLAVVTTQPAQAQTFTVLYNFAGPTSDGAYPYAILLRDKAGNLYGTTYYGGSGYAGTVYKIDTTGTETTVYNFTGGSDGGYPFASLIGDSAGNLYGTTADGGTSGQGTVFKIDTTGAESVLYNFAGGTTDGCYPYGGILTDVGGNMYGTTGSCGAYSEGTVWKIDTTGTETLLHSFAGGSTDGAYPYYTTLIRKKGSMYGLTEGGGASSTGVVYRINRKSGAVTVLHSFAGGTTDGCYPYGTPTIDPKGNLYGTTDSCGASSQGTVWEVSKKGTATLVHSFAGGTTDGAYPLDGLNRDSKGNLYGVTEEGGANSTGTVFELSKNGTITLLHSFSYSSDGGYPVGAVIRVKGTISGTAVDGGSSGYGTVWQLTK